MASITQYMRYRESLLKYASRRGAAKASAKYNEKPSNIYRWRSVPKHNGKVERSHREDQKLLYSEVARLNKPFKELDDYKTRLKRHQNKTNNRPMRPLYYQSPLDYLKKSR